jgi:hypothetical protein
VPTWIARDQTSAEQRCYWYQTVTAQTITAAYYPNWNTSASTGIWTTAPTQSVDGRYYWTTANNVPDYESQRGERADRAAWCAALDPSNQQEADRLGRIIAERDRATAAARNHEAVARRVQELEREHREQAEHRARGLLLDHLTPEQRETYERDRWFIVEGESKTRYRVRDLGHMVANVEMLNENNTVRHRLCAHVPMGRVPMGDQLLAQKIMLECSEPDFLRIANRH